MSAPLQMVPHLYPEARPPPYPLIHPFAALLLFKEARLRGAVDRQDDSLVGLQVRGQASYMFPFRVGGRMLELSGSTTLPRNWVVPFCLRQTPVGDSPDHHHWPVDWKPEGAQTLPRCECCLVMRASHCLAERLY